MLNKRRNQLGFLDWSAVQFKYYVLCRPVIEVIREVKVKKYEKNFTLLVCYSKSKQKQTKHDQGRAFQKSCPNLLNKPPNSLNKLPPSPMEYFFCGNNDVVKLKNNFRRCIKWVLGNFSLSPKAIKANSMRKILS